MAVVESEGHPVDGAARQADLARWDGKTDPGSCGWQGAHGPPRSRAVGSTRDDVLTPVRAMLPVGVVPLEHDLPRWIARIDQHVSDQKVSVLECHRFRCPIEIVLMISGRQRVVVGLGPTCFLRGIPVPDSSRLSAGWKCVVKPHRLGW